jgi:hypothetical protein
MQSSDKWSEASDIKLPDSMHYAILALDLSSLDATTYKKII